MEDARDPAEVVRAFLTEVRSGKKPGNARNYMAASVTAHQVNSESPSFIMRTPEDYARHIEEFLELYGDFELEIKVLISQSDKVYASWKQTGHHLREIDGFPPTGRQLTQFASAVYRIEHGMIAEYWIQIDRLGLLQQLSEMQLVQ